MDHDSIHEAAFQGDIQALERLLQDSTNVNILNQNGLSHSQIIEELCNHGANVNDTNRAGDTALMFAAAKGNVNVVAKIIDLKANVNATNHNGLTALMLAAMNAKVEVVKAMVERGAGILRLESDLTFVDVKYRNKAGKSALDITKDEACKQILQNKMKELDDQALLVQKEIEKETKSQTKSKKKKTTQQTKPTNKPTETHAIEETTEEEKPSLTQNSDLSRTVHVDHKLPESVVDTSNWETVGKKKTTTVLQSHKPKASLPTTSTIPSPSKQKIPSVWNSGMPTDSINKDLLAKPQNQSELEDLENQILQFPLSSELDLKVRYFVGLDLHTLSMEQLSALEQMHYSLVAKINEAKIDLIRRQERLKLEEEIALNEQRKRVQYKTKT